MRGNRRKKEALLENIKTLATMVTLMGDKFNMKSVVCPLDRSNRLQNFRTGHCNIVPNAENAVKLREPLFSAVNALQ